jgi:hypothetical protein
MTKISYSFFYIFVSQLSFSLGKVLIIKALIIPIFTFIVSSCVIPEKYKKEIESKCFKFIWNGKPDKVKRNTLTGDFESKNRYNQSFND